MADLLSELKFRDPARARALAGAIAREVKAIGRARSPSCTSAAATSRPSPASGCAPSCRRSSWSSWARAARCASPTRRRWTRPWRSPPTARVVCTYGDMLKLPGTVKSLADAQADGGRVEVIYSASQAVDLARAQPSREVVFFASGFETTAVATAAVVLAGTPANFSVLSAHKYVPSAMEVVAEMRGDEHRGVPRRRPRRHHHRLRHLRALRAEDRDARGRRGLRAARHPGRHPETAWSSSGRSGPRWRTATRAA